jgi:hypothetical protein
MKKQRRSVWLVLAGLGVTASAGAAVDNVLLLIDQSLHAQVQVKLERYEDEVEDRFPVDLQIHVGTFGSYTAEQIRAYILDEYNTYGLTGVILAGQIDYAVWVQGFGTNEGILSFFYEDLDGSFSDTDGDGKYDWHDWGTQDGPEIWSCWMRPPIMDQAGFLNALFDEAHAYYTGQWVTGKRALVACHNDYDNNFWPSGSTIPSMPALVDIYGLANVDTDGEGADPVVSHELETVLFGDTYEIAHFWSHANSGGQYWDSGVTYNYEVMDALPGTGPLIAHIYGCHSGDFTEYEGLFDSWTTIAVAYAFGPGGGQAASGTSWSYGTEGMNHITEAMRDGGYLAEGWKYLLDTRETAVAIHQRYPTRDVHTELSGNNLFGNPFLYADYTGYVVPDGDMDGDGEVSLDDYVWWADCHSGPGIATPPAGCDRPDFDNADLDADGDVDLMDWARFAEAYAGPTA